MGYVIPTYFNIPHPHTWKPHSFQPLEKYNTNISFLNINEQHAMPYLLSQLHSIGISSPTQNMDAS